MQAGRMLGVLSSVAVFALAMHVAPVGTIGGRVEAAQVTGDQIVRATNPSWLSVACRQFVASEAGRKTQAIESGSWFMPSIGMDNCPAPRR